ncbi:hypothetical protein J5277_29690 [Rhizobium sp. 16-449-1b]|uniref:hypothetical protein n=1 Tax=Rhizobium sp. 16-449-1b TaxID=2819989 RepID=UPI001ADD1541|nr:hypothetical protein [Rhizobium sp. 16-449-1b]MBO9198304.1 hypothetical protein [Rhizobium sp. 16-449-1b]
MDQCRRYVKTDELQADDALPPRPAADEDDRRADQPYADGVAEGLEPKRPAPSE